MTVELLNKLFTFIFSFFGVCFFYGTKSNEGYPGKGIDFFQYNITEWMRSNYPDVVLLMVGTNDVWPYHPDDIIDVAVLISKMRLLFDSILSTRPEVKLVVSSIPPSADYWNKWVIAYNSKLHQSLRIQLEPCQRNNHLDLTLG